MSPKAALFLVELFMDGTKVPRDIVLEAVAVLGEKGGPTGEDELRVVQKLVAPLSAEVRRELDGFAATKEGLPEPMTFFWTDALSAVASVSRAAKERVHPQDFAFALAAVVAKKHEAAQARAQELARTDYVLAHSSRGRNEEGTA